MSTKAKEPPEDDVVVARALSSYAQLRTHLASWGGLPATSATPDPETEDNDEDIFTAESDVAGVGFVEPQDGDADTRQAKTSTNNLRKQMLGKRVRDPNTGLERRDGPKKVARPLKSTPWDDEDSEEDAGRSGVGKKRRHTNGDSNPTASEGDDQNRKASSHDNGKSVQRPGSYLDEVMAERSKKRKKKKIKVKDMDKDLTVVDSTNDT